MFFHPNYRVDVNINYHIRACGQHTLARIPTKHTCHNWFTPNRIDIESIGFLLNIHLTNIIVQVYSAAAKMVKLKPTHTLEIRYWLTEMVAHFDVHVSRFTRFRIKFHVIVYTFREYFEHKIQCKTSLWPKAYISGLAFIYQSEIQWSYFNRPPLFFANR